MHEMQCGDTFLMPAPGGPLKSHLWIVITAPDERGNAVIVSLTTLRTDRDQTVILSAGDHPFVRHQTTVFYGDARIVDLQELSTLFGTHAAVRHQPCSPKLLKLIQDGALVSPYTPQKIVDFCRRSWKR